MEQLPRDVEAPRGATADEPEAERERMEVEWRRRREAFFKHASMPASERRCWRPNGNRMRREAFPTSPHDDDDDVFPLTVHFHDKAYARHAARRQASGREEGGRRSAGISASSRKQRTNQQKPKSRGDRELLHSGCVIVGFSKPKALQPGYSAGWPRPPWVSP